MSNILQKPKTVEVRKSKLFKQSQYFASRLRKKFHKNPQNADETKEIMASKVIVVPNKTEESPSMLSVTNAKGLLQITEVLFQGSFQTEKVLVL